VFVNKGRNIIANVENQPDRDESRNAVKVNLHEISNNVLVKKSHRDLR
jgi:hypothetical protein